MGAIFKKGETKVRPGVYRRYENVGSSGVPGAVYGVFVIPIQAETGPLATVTTHSGAEGQRTLREMYGSNGTVDAALALFDGGATKVFAYRLGTGGTKGSITLVDTTSGTAIDVVTLTTKYETSIAYKVTVRDSLSDSNARELVVYAADGTSVVETITFAKGSTEPQAIVTAVNSNSKVFTATKLDDGNGILAAITGTAITEGTAPTVVTNDYDTAFTAFEPFKWNMLVLDTTDSAVRTLAESYINRIYQAGTLGVACMGEPTSVSFSDRKSHATAYNNEKIIYCGSGYVANDENVDGYLSIATQAGIIGSTSGAQSILHTVIPQATDTLEKLTNSQYEEAINAGLLLLSQNDDGQVWFDASINSLVTPGPDQDEGWKKIRRTTIRFEMFDRIDKILAPLVGKVNCDNDGIADVVSAGQSVLDAMVAENKLKQGPTFGEDAEYQRGSDYAYFVIAADDMDSLEKIYLRYQFRFTAE